MSYTANHLEGTTSVCFKSCNLPIKYEVFWLKWWTGTAGIKAGTSYHDPAVMHPNQNWPYLQITPWSIQLYHLILTLISYNIANVHEAASCYTEDRKSSVRKRKTDHIKYKICSQQGICSLKKTVLHSVISQHNTMHQFNSLWVLHTSFKHQLHVSQWEAKLYRKTVFQKFWNFETRNHYFPYLKRMSRHL